jgi:uncharacterized protein YbjQ (UPF0145 family)
MFAQAEPSAMSEVLPWLLVVGIVIVVFVKVVLPMIIASRQTTDSANGNNMKFHTVEELEEELKSFDYSTSPRSATLTPHEIYLLKQAGYEPVQIVFGNVVYSMGIAGLFRTVMRAFTRGEMFDFTRLNKDARHLARNRLLTEAQSLGATDVFGVFFDTKEYADFIEIIATGTAVKKVASLTTTPIAVGV